MLYNNNILPHVDTTEDTTNVTFFIPENNLKTAQDFRKNGYTNKQRACSLRTRQENKRTTIERIIEMKSEGFKHKYIAEVLHIHVKHIPRLLREYKSV